MKTLILAVLASLALLPSAEAAQKSEKTAIRSAHKKIGEGGLKGRQHWWNARHGGVKTGHGKHGQIVHYRGPRRIFKH